jgi:histidine kinase
LDVVVSLKDTEKEILTAQKSIMALAIFVFLVTSASIFVFVDRFVIRSIKKLIEGTQRIAKGEYAADVNVKQADEMGQLAQAINKMGKEIAQQQSRLNEQRDEYQDLFERVPCLITVQDTNYRLIRYNREFADMFDPQPGDRCYHAYKGRDEKCVICPVEETFQDGFPHHSEESGINKDGTTKHWIVRTSPIRNANGEIIAAMEINLDITARKNLEVELEKSEKKYHAIFSNIPNPVFVLDKNTLEILDCNKSVETVYGYTVEELHGKSFLSLFLEADEKFFQERIKISSVLNQVKHLGKDNRTLFVNIRISPSEYSGQKVFLVTTSDITKRLEAEQQLIQASKMATLGEMATGVAHELNQPLSVIKTVTSFLTKKISKSEKIDIEIERNMLTKADVNVDRATKIINHMRQFARKSNMEMEKVFLNDILESAFEIFSQQLKVRGIRVVWKTDPNLPRIQVDPGRLEQVFINLLLNARDAIEEKWLQNPVQKGNDTITINTYCEDSKVVSQICDTGVGIPEELIGRIFEPFFTTKEVGKGTGLGLSISYGIVKECNGAITAFSSDQGTCFTLTFPCQVKNE